jgi:hypothetical protein
MSNTSNNAVVNNPIPTITTTTGTGIIPSNGSFITTNGTGQLYHNYPNSSFKLGNTADQILTAKTDPAELEVKGRVVINGVDLEERLRNIEKVLLIPERDVKLEAKHPKLKKLYDEYMAALGKYRTFESLKGDE